MVNDRVMRKHISLLSALLLPLASCVDHRFDYLPEDTVYFADDEVQEVTLSVMSASDYVHDIWVHKAGYFQDRFIVHLETDYSYLVEYNNDNGTSWEMLDPRYYDFPREFEIPESEDEGAVQLTLRTEQVIDDLGYGTYYIPVSLSSYTPYGSVNGDMSHIILSITLRQPIMSIDSEYRGEVTLDLSESTAPETELDITAMLDVETTEELTVTWTRDGSLLEADEHELGAEYCSYEPSAVMPVGEQYAENYLTLDIENMPVGRWVLPIRVSTTNDKVDMAEDAYLKLTVIRGTLDDKITWTTDLLQGDELIVSSGTMSGTAIATVPADGFEVISDADWFTVINDAGTLKLTVVSENTSGIRENVATFTLKDDTSLLEKTVTVRQGMAGCGIILNKSLWSLAAWSSNVQDRVDNEQIYRLFDNSWPTGSADGTKHYVEFNDRQDPSDPFVFTFDLGENPRRYNAFGIMPRLQWTQQAPHTVMIEVSDDMQSWTTVVEKKDGNCFSEEDLNYGDSGWNNHYEGIIHWCRLADEGTLTARYIRLSVYEGFQSQQNYSIICMDEVFVSENPDFNE